MNGVLVDSNILFDVFLDDFLKDCESLSWLPMPFRAMAGETRGSSTTVAGAVSVEYKEGSRRTIHRDAGAICLTASY